MSIQDLVHEFRERNGLPNRTTPTLPPVLEVLTDCRLITEESSEYVAAASKFDLVEMADALADLAYVTYGAADCMGIKLDEVIEEVHRSNMTKSGLVDEGGKFVKAAGWSRPDIEKVLNRQREDIG